MVDLYHFIGQNSVNPRKHSKIISLFAIVITPFSTFRVHYRALYKTCVIAYYYCCELIPSMIQTKIEVINNHDLN